MRWLLAFLLCVGVARAQTNPQTNGIQFLGSCPPTGAAGTMCLNATSSVTANASIGSGPARAFIFFITLSETAGHAVTLNLGTTLGASNVASGLYVPANGSLLVTAQALSSAWFASAQPLYVSSASWGGAVINEQTEYLVGP
jgi:hypothetical protein